MISLAGRDVQLTGVLFEVKYHGNSTERMDKKWALAFGIEMCESM